MCAHFCVRVRYEMKKTPLSSFLISLPSHEFSPPCRFGPKNHIRIGYVMQHMGLVCAQSDFFFLPRHGKRKLFSRSRGGEIHLSKRENGGRLNFATNEHTVSLSPSFSRASSGKSEAKKLWHDFLPRNSAIFFATLKRNTELKESGRVIPYYYLNLIFPSPRLVSL